MPKATKEKRGAIAAPKALTSPQTTSKNPSESWVEMTEIVMPQHTNAHGTVFGGVVMSWVDIAGATCALRHCRKPVVTASIDALHFLAPIRQGYIVTIRASLNYVGQTSCEVGVKVMSEDPISGERHHTSSAYLTFVSLDGLGRPIAMPQIKPVTPDEKRRHREAQIRRKNRLHLKDAIKAKGGVY